MSHSRFTHAHSSISICPSNIFMLVIWIRGYHSNNYSRVHLSYLRTFHSSRRREVNKASQEGEWMLWQGSVSTFCINWCLATYNIMVLKEGNKTPQCQLNYLHLVILVFFLMLQESMWPQTWRLGTLHFSCGSPLAPLPHLLYHLL